MCKAGTYHVGSVLAAGGNLVAAMMAVVVL